MFYNHVYSMLYDFANYQVGGYLLCRLLAPIVLLMLVWISRIIQSVMIKFFAVFIAALLYSLPAVVRLFYG